MEVREKGGPQKADSGAINRIFVLVAATATVSFLVGLGVALRYTDRGGSPPSVLDTVEVQGEQLRPEPQPEVEQEKEKPEENPLPPVQPGSKIQSVLEPSDSSGNRADFELRSDAAERVVVEVHSLDFDTRVQVSEFGPAGAKPLASNDDGGIGSNSQLDVRTEPGKRYRITVHPAREGRGGPFELAVRRQDAPAVHGGLPESDYWQQVMDRATQTGDPLREADAVVELHYRKGGATKQALERALEIHRTALGPEHPDVAMSTNTLALYHIRNGQLGRAEELCRAALEIVGNEHAMSGSSFNLLGWIYEVRKEHSKAAAYYERAVAVGEKVGSRDLDSYLSNLGKLYGSQRRTAEAEKALKRAIKLAREEDDSETLLSAAYKLVGIYWELDRIQDAARIVEPLAPLAVEIKGRNSQLTKDFFMVLQHAGTAPAGKRCGACGGSGRQWDYSGPRPRQVECYNCFGSGREPS